MASAGERRPLDPGGLLLRGVAGGLVAGVVFLLAHMWFALSQGMSALSPMYIMATVFRASEVPVHSPEEAVVGLVTHGALSLGFGMGFGLLLVPWLRSVRGLVAGALGFGLVLWVVNLHVLGRFIFTAFSPSAVEFQVFGGLAHVFVFGLLMVPFFLAVPGRR